MIFRPAQRGEKVGRVSKVIVYEDNPNKKKIDINTLSQEEKILAIRFGLDAVKRNDDKVAVNLLKKYKPIINLNKERALFKQIE